MNERTPAAGLGKEPFPYEELLAYYRGALRNRARCALIARKIDEDDRWKAHWDSIQQLDLERAAAIQDGVDLEQFDTASAGAFCREVARTDGGVLTALSRRKPAEETGGWTRQEWSEHIRQCTYCRRMRRRAFAGVHESPQGETLLRDWLLEDYYLPALERITATLAAGAAVAEATLLKIVLRGSLFTELQNDTMRPLADAPEGDIHGWRYRAAPLPAASRVPELALLDEASPTHLTLERNLPGGAGRVEIGLAIAGDGTVTCAARVVRTDDPATRLPVAVRVDCQGMSLVELSGTDDVLERKESLPAAEHLPGSSLRIRVTRGAEPLLDLSLQFQE